MKTMIAAGKRLSEMTRSKRADRREAKKNAPCPHDWTTNGTGHVCRICGMSTSGDGKLTERAGAVQEGGAK